MIPLTNKQQELYEKTKICYICKKTFEHKYTNDENNHKGQNPCHFTGKYGGSAHSICNSKYSISKKVYVVFTMDWTVIIFYPKTASKRVWRRIWLSRRKCWKIQKTLKVLIKNEEMLQKQYLTKYNLLIAQGLWQAHYQILLIILLKEFIKLNTKMNAICEACGIKYRDCESCLEYTNLEDYLILYRYLCCNKN